MRVQILSDIHLEIERSDSKPGEEFYCYDIPVHAEQLALLGDIGWTLEDRLLIWLTEQLKKFKTVFFLCGNHEPYRSSIEKSHSRLEAFSLEVNADPSLGQFIFLNRTRHDASPILTILGCTLWSALNPDDLDILSWSLTDFKRIDDFNPDVYSAAHRKDVEWLNTTISAMAREEPERKVVVFTHHAPTIPDTADPKFMDQPTGSAFATELTKGPCWVSGNVALWAFGHTHWSCDFVREGVRVYSNQRGYRNGDKGYDVARVLDL
ncbi:hypothetical protein EUX98_g7813 [Antrodiella citrinella]|uniref:Calcineurin-like phosphoesterase domain-containing protein n=1 Tax=Antrodiella citrinella TaxID=2447956 RepID=A0A4S4MKK9_9APHY|nr:hypothetical protein EUX98_g7813 [Antrodiella citrinella]